MADDASGDGSDDNESRRESTTDDDGFTVGFEDAASTGSEVDVDGRKAGAADDHDSDRDRIPLDLSSDADETAEAAGDEDDPYAPEPSSAPVEAGDPDLENAVFVVLGAVVMVLVVLRVVSIPM